MALTSVTAGATALVTDVNQYKNALEGASTNTWLLKAATTTHFQVQLADNGGSYSFKILDNDGSAVATIDSNGNLTLVGSFSPGTLVLPLSASPAQTTEGQIVWDSDDDVITVGDGSSRKTFYPGGPSYKYKVAAQAQNFTTSTYTDITATSGNLAFTAAANQAYEAEWIFYMSAIGTGGIKAQLTGPAGPTAVQIFAEVPYSDGVQSQLYGITGQAFSVVTAFSSTIFTGTSTNFAVGTYRITALIVNGSTAGAVTLQLAQNSAAGTTTINSGRMIARLLTVAT